MLRVTSILACWRERVLEKGQFAFRCCATRDVMPLKEASRGACELTDTYLGLLSAHSLLFDGSVAHATSTNSAYIWRTPLEAARGRGGYSRAAPHEEGEHDRTGRCPHGRQLGAVSKHRLSTPADGDWHDARRRRG